MHASCVQPSRIEFIGAALPDTVFTGAGTTTFNEEPGHFGRGTSRPIQMSCQTAIWGPSARGVRDSVPGVFAARLRQREHLAGDLPTLDIIPFLQPYREPRPDTTARAGAPQRALVVTSSGAPDEERRLVPHRFLPRGATSRDAAWHDAWGESRLATARGHLEPTRGTGLVPTHRRHRMRTLERRRRSRRWLHGAPPQLFATVSHRAQV